MDESEDNMSSEDIKTMEGSSLGRTKPKKRSLVERELETNLTAHVTSPMTNGDSSSTSRYGRTRRFKTEADHTDPERYINVMTSPNHDSTTATPVKIQSPVYKMHASNSPIKTEKDTPTEVILSDSNLDSQIENIYHENISLSRFSSEEKKSPAPKFPKVYVRTDLIQKREKDECIMLIKNLFSPAKSAKKSNSHLNNILERSSDKYSLNTSSENTNSYNGLSSNSSVVKTLDFDGNKKKKNENKDGKPVMSKSDLFELEAKCEYQVGDLAWARMGTYPFWPCIVTREPASGMFVKKKLFGRTEHDIIHVTFFGDNGRRSWIVNSMLRRFQGQLEFEATRDTFSPSAKKKDPRLYAAFFVSEKKMAQWSISVEEAETLLREPKRLRIDILYDMLAKSRTIKTTQKQQSSSKTHRTASDVASDVSLSESLYDTLFSEDDGKSEDTEKSRSKIRVSLDVSDVVTACLDNMAAKTGITKIQRQSHMDRWLQKAKSKTPEKLQAPTHLPPPQKEKEVKVASAKNKKKLSPIKVRIQKPYSLRKTSYETRILKSHDNEHDYSTTVSNDSPQTDGETKMGFESGSEVKVESLHKTDEFISAGMKDTETIVGSNISCSALQGISANAIKQEDATLVDAQEQTDSTQVNMCNVEENHLLLGNNEKSIDFAQKVDENTADAVTSTFIPDKSTKGLQVISDNVNTKRRAKATNVVADNGINTEKLTESKLLSDSNKQSTEFIKYLEMRQDAVIDEHPSLSQDEIEDYLYKIWLYEDSSRADIKNDDRNNQSKANSRKKATDKKKKRCLSLNSNKNKKSRIKPDCVTLAINSFCTPVRKSLRGGLSNSPATPLDVKDRTSIVQERHTVETIGRKLNDAQIINTETNLEIKEQPNCKTVTDSTVTDTGSVNIAEEPSTSAGCRKHIDNTSAMNSICKPVRRSLRRRLSNSAATPLDIDDKTSILRENTNTVEPSFDTEVETKVNVTEPKLEVTDQLNERKITDSQATDSESTNAAEEHSISAEKQIEVTSSTNSLCKPARRSLRRRLSNSAATPLDIDDKTSILRENTNTVEPSFDNEIVTKVYGTEPKLEVTDQPNERKITDSQATDSKSTNAAEEPSISAEKQIEVTSSTNSLCKPARRSLRRRLSNSSATPIDIDDKTSILRENTNTVEPSFDSEIETKVNVTEPKLEVTDQPNEKKIIDSQATDSKSTNAAEEPSISVGKQIEVTSSTNSLCKPARRSLRRRLSNSSATPINIDDKTRMLLENNTLQPSDEIKTETNTLVSVFSNTELNTKVMQQPDDIIVKETETTDAGSTNIAEEPSTSAGKQMDVTSASNSISKPVRRSLRRRLSHNSAALSIDEKTSVFGESTNAVEPSDCIKLVGNVSDTELTSEVTTYLIDKIVTESQVTDAECKNIVEDQIESAGIQTGLTSASNSFCKPVRRSLRRRLSNSLSTHIDINERASILSDTINSVKPSDNIEQVTYVNGTEIKPEIIEQPDDKITKECQETEMSTNIAEEQGKSIGKQNEAAPASNSLCKPVRRSLRRRLSNSPAESTDINDRMTIVRINTVDTTESTQIVTKVSKTTIKPQVIKQPDNEIGIGSQGSVTESTNNTEGNNNPSKPIFLQVAGVPIIGKENTTQCTDSSKNMERQTETHVTSIVQDQINSVTVSDEQVPTHDSIMENQTDTLEAIIEQLEDTLNTNSIIENQLGNIQATAERQANATEVNSIIIEKQIDVEVGSEQQAETNVNTTKKDVTDNVTEWQTRRRHGMSNTSILNDNEDNSIMNTSVEISQLSHESLIGVDAVEINQSEGSHKRSSQCSMPKDLKPNKNVQGTENIMEDSEITTKNAIIQTCTDLENSVVDTRTVTKHNSDITPTEISKLIREHSSVSKKISHEAEEPCALKEKQAVIEKPTKNYLEVPVEDKEYGHLDFVFSALNEKLLVENVSKPIVESTAINIVLNKDNEIDRNVNIQSDNRISRKIKSKTSATNFISSNASLAHSIDISANSNANSVAVQIKNNITSIDTLSSCKYKTLYDQCTEFEVRVQRLPRHSLAQRIIKIKDLNKENILGNVCQNGVESILSMNDRKNIAVNDITESIIENGYDTTCTGTIHNVEQNNTISVDKKNNEVIMSVDESNQNIGKSIENVQHNCVNEILANDGENMLCNGIGHKKETSRKTEPTQTVKHSETSKSAVLSDEMSISSKNADADLNKISKKDPLFNRRIRKKRISSKNEHEQVLKQPTEDLSLLSAQPVSKKSVTNTKTDLVKLPVRNTLPYNNNTHRKNPCDTADTEPSVGHNTHQSTVPIKHNSISSSKSDCTETVKNTDTSLNTLKKDDQNNDKVKLEPIVIVKSENVECNQIKPPSALNGFVYIYDDDEDEFESPAFSPIFKEPIEPTLDKEEKDGEINSEATNYKNVNQKSTLEDNSTENLIKESLKSTETQNKDLEIITNAEIKKEIDADNDEDEIMTSVSRLPEPVRMNGYHLDEYGLDFSDNDFNAETSSINSEDSEPLSCTKTKLLSKNRKNPKKALQDADFVKYLEMRQDALMDEHPELNQDEIVEYLYNTWQYEENAKSDIRKNDDIEQAGLVKGLNDNLRQKSIRNSYRDKKRNKKQDNDIQSINSSISKKWRKKVDDDTSSINSDVSDTSIKRRLRTRLSNSPALSMDENEVSVSKDSSPERKPDIDDKMSLYSDDCIKVTKRRIRNQILDDSLDGEESFFNSKEEPKSKDELLNIVEVKKEEPEPHPNKSSPKEKWKSPNNHRKGENKSPRGYKSKIKNYFSVLNSAKDTNITHTAEQNAIDLETKIKEEYDPDAVSITSVNSEDSEVSLSKRKQRKNVDKSVKSKDDPEFLKYVELRQDALIDENPQLTQDEIVAYLYKTWLYEESVKSDLKKSDDIEQANLVKGLSSETQVKKPKKKIKVEKNTIDEEVVTKDKPRRKISQPYYNEDIMSDIEDELELFEIFKTKKKTIKSEDGLGEVKKPNEDQTNDEHEIVETLDEVDEVELYFSQLALPKPNLFKGMVREKVCEICEKTGNLIKCKGCSGMFHVACDKIKKEHNDTGVVPAARGRKKKKKLGRRPKNYEDSGSHSDEKSHDISEEHNGSIEEVESEPRVVDEAVLEEVLTAKMKEILPTIDLTYDSYSSDDGLDWNSAPPGQCEIVDIKLKPKTVVDYSDFKCKSCQMYTTPICFVCKEATSKTGVDHRQKCQTNHCNKYYHLECLDHWPQTQFNSGEPSKSNKKISEHFEAVMCPRHVCHTCVSDDPRGCKTRFSGDKLARCVRCPATYHSFTKCLPAGTQILTGSLIVCPRHYEHRPGKVPCHVNTGWCFICALGGSLICCEYCPTSFHAECLNINPPEGGYMCEDCETGRLPLYGEMVWVKLGHYRWWPGIILHPGEIPENIMAVKHSPGEFVVRFFGQYDHYWVNRGRVFPFQEGDSGRISTQKSKIDAAFITAMEHAHRAFEILKTAEPNDEESLDIASSLLPPHYVKLKVNKPCGALAGRRADLADAALAQCECAPRDPEPCGPYSHCLNRMLLTECGPICRAGDRCLNRAFEKRLYPKMVPYRTPHRGWGLKTLEDIKAGQFVIEYVGELIDEEEFRRRMNRMHEIRDENFYFLTLDKERMIDAGPKGNLARFMNHSCEPNCETQKWTVLGDVRVGLFALYDIPANSEVTFNYNLECAGIEKKRCLCGARLCSGYIGAKPKQEESQPKKKRAYKKRAKPVEESPSTKNKPKRPVGRPAKPRELTEIEKDLLIIKNATNGISSDSESSSRLNSLDKSNPKALKRKRMSFSTEESDSSSSKKKEDLSPCAKKAKIEEKPEVTTTEGD